MPESSEPEPSTEEPETSEPVEGEPSPSDIPSFQPIPLSELAPAPSQDQVLGNVDELLKQHEDELEEFKKAREKNKLRADQDLQEKLRQRRSRKRKLQQEKMTGKESGDSVGE
jgi:hypothetical protein